jgi:hypothetical protein
MPYTAISDNDHFIELQYSLLGICRLRLGFLHTAERQFHRANSLPTPTSDRHCKVAFKMLRRCSDGQELGELMSTARNTYTNAGVALHIVISRKCPSPCRPSFPRITCWRQQDSGSTSRLHFSSPQSADESQGLIKLQCLQPLDVSMILAFLAGALVPLDAVSVLFVLPANSTVCDCSPVISKSFSDKKPSSSFYSQHVVVTVLQSI